MCLESLTCVLEGPTARRGTLMSNPPLGSFSPLKHGSLGGSRPPSQSQMVFRIACRTLGRKNGGSDQVLLEGGKHCKSTSRVCGIPGPLALEFLRYLRNMFILGPTPRDAGLRDLRCSLEVCTLQVPQVILMPTGYENSALSLRSGREAE